MSDTKFTTVIPRFHSTQLRNLANVLVFVLFLPVFLQAQDYSTEVEYAIKVLEGLRERRLFDLAETYAQEQLASDAIPQSEKSLIVLEQIQTKVAQAISSNKSDRTSAWNAAEQIALDFGRDFPEHPGTLLVLIQDALIHYSRGNLIQQEIEAEIVPEQFKQLALEQFRKATTKFREIEKQIVAKIPVAPKQSSSSELNQDQLINLKNSVRFRMAGINLAKAQLYDATDRLNRVDSLNQVLARLEEVITQSNSELPLWWNAQIAKAKCLRLKRDSRSLQILFSNLPGEPLSKEIGSGLLTERVHTAVDFGDKSKWRGLFNEYEKSENPTPHLRLAVLKMLMVEASMLSDSTKKQRQQLASQLVKRIELEHGKYWGRRAEIVLVGSVSGNSDGDLAESDLEFLIRQGNTAFRKKNFEDAIKAYSKATQFAIDTGLAKQALANSVRVAQCYENLGQHREAAAAMFAAANKFPQEKSANSVHLRAAWNLGQLENEQDLLIESLKHHVKTWPELAGANQALLWLGNAFERKLDWKSALESYLAVELKSSQAIEANNRIRNLVQSWLDKSERKGGSRENTAREIVNILGPNLNLTEWTTPAQLRCLAMIEVGLTQGVLDPRAAIEKLSIINQSSGDLLDEVPAWLVVAIAKDVVDTGSDHSRLINNIKELPNDPGKLKVVLRGIKNSLSKSEQANLATAVEMICDKALVDNQSKDQEFWIIEKAIAKSSSASASGSTVGLAELADKYPKSLRIQMAYASALAKTGDASAIQQWRRVAAKVKKGSDAWYESKYNVVELMVAGGQKEEAAKLVRYLEATSAGWKESGWNRKFNQLIK